MVNISRLYLGLLFLPLSAIASSSCPKQPWNKRCPRCCEQGWLACECPGNGILTGYPVPCCRENNICTPCVDYPGCNVFSNCKTCHINTRSTYLSYSEQEVRFCASCNQGWSGGDCRKCGGVLKEKLGFIELDKYPNEAECLWTIDATRNSIVELRFERFNLESDSQCSYDYLSLYDGAFLPEAKIESYCGNDVPPRYISRTHVVALYFKSDETSTYGGFRISYRELNACARRPCYNGGACMLTTSVEYVCVCTIGFSGSLCELTVRCRLPPLSPYLTYTLDSKGLSYGAKVRYGCQKEFYALGPSASYCKANGKWTENPPSCVPSCQKPKIPKNAFIDDGIFIVNSKISYSCKSDYHLVGERSRTCTKNKKWSHSAPYCVPNNKCADPGTPDNGHRTIITSATDPYFERSNNSQEDFMWPQTSVHFECNHNYKLIGSRTRICLLNGSLTGQQPSCVPDPEPTCPPIEVVNYRSLSIVYDRSDWTSTTDMTNSTFPPGTKAEITCLAPFVLIGSMARYTCLPNGTWIPEMGKSSPRCVNATSCPVLPPLFGGRIRLNLGLEMNTTMMFVNSTLSNFAAFNLIPVGSKAVYECIGSLVLSEHSPRVCMEGGRWSGVEPVCVKGCKDPGKSSHSKMISWIGIEATPEEQRRSSEVLNARQKHSRLPVGTVLTFECISEKFFMRGIPRRVCTANGKWSTSENPYCLPRCGAFPGVSSKTIYRKVTDDRLKATPWPWHVVIKRQLREADEQRVQCGGAYIGNNLVLTVAQCVTFSSTILPFQPHQIQVGLGVNVDNDVMYTHDVAEIIIHSDFDPILHDYDVALLVLSNEVKLDARGRLWPVCISGDDEYLAPRSRTLVIGEKGIASAWTEHHVTEETVNQLLRGLPTPDSSDVINVGGSMNDSDDNDTTTENATMLSSKQRSTTSPTDQSQTEDLNGREYANLKRTREKVEYFNVTRETNSKCERVFLEDLVSSRMICGLQAIVKRGERVQDSCYERRGSPLVVYRTVRYTNRRRSRRHKRRSKQRFSKCSLHARRARSIAGSNEVPADKKSVLKLKNEFIADNPVKEPKMKSNSDLPKQVWLLEGLSSWTARGSCQEHPLNRYTVFVKVRAFAEWIALKRKELQEKGLLLPPA